MSSLDGYAGHPFRDSKRTASLVEPVRRDKTDTGAPEVRLRQNRYLKEKAEREWVAPLATLSASSLRA